jgi:threonine dehydrogenase-like Zn-dependent dehydrogenase
MASGAVDNRKIITTRFALDEVLQAIKQSGARTDGKILVRPR